MSQTFKKTIDKDILFDFLEKISDKNEKFYTFDINAYKRAELLDIIIIMQKCFMLRENIIILVYVQLLDKSVNYILLCSLPKLYTVNLNTTFLISFIFKFIERNSI